MIRKNTALANFTFGKHPENGSVADLGNHVHVTVCNLGGSLYFVTRPAHRNILGLYGTRRSGRTLPRFCYGLKEGVIMSYK